MGYVLDLLVLIGVRRIFGGGGVGEFRTKGLLIFSLLLLLAHFFWEFLFIFGSWAFIVWRVLIGIDKFYEVSCF